MIGGGSSGFLPRREAVQDPTSDSFMAPPLRLLRSPSAATGGTRAKTKKSVSRPDEVASLRDAGGVPQAPMPRR